MGGFILAIDQGTTSTRSIVFDDGYRVCGIGQQEFPQHFPASGWVEHDAEDIWRTVVDTMRLALASAKISAADLAGIGITNQRETTVIWDRASGEAIHRAIVWQDRRTAALCDRLKAEGTEDWVRERTGLLLDTVDGARERAERGELAFGTIDSYLLWRLTDGKVHATDATNAARTLLLDIRDGSWSDDLLRLFRVPRSLLPEVRDCAADFGVTNPAILGAAVPIAGIAGDQHAATLGQACFAPGMMKATYGTGCFALLNTGAELVASQNRLLTTIAYRLDGKTTYALEGSIFVAGSAIQWLRDGLHILERADQSGPMAAEADPAQRLYLVPAFTGLGAPWWDPHARGALFGLTRASGPNEFVRAALESVCFQTRDLLDAMRRDWQAAGETVLRVDGGMVASDWTMQRLADILDAPVDRPVVLETTALGAAWLAGRQRGVWPAEQGFADSWRRERRFLPSMAEADRQSLVAGWGDAVRRTLTSRAGS